MKTQDPRRVASLAVCALLLASLAFAGFAGTETYLAAIGNPQGAGGAQFYSDVWITNVSASSVSYSFQFLQAGQANLTPASFSDSLTPGQTKRYTDVVGTQLHLTNVNGAARILSSGEIFVAERIYNQPAAVPLSQTAGQFFSGIPKGFSISLGQSATLQGVYLGSGLDFRYNYVLLETSGNACTVHVQALDDAGTQLGATDVPLLPYEHLLLSANAVAPAASTSNARLAATVTAGSGTVLFAGSQVGNGGPQDQSGFEMSFRDALLGSAGVTSLNGLTGAVTLTAGTNVTFGGSGNNIVINASGGGGGLSAVSHDGTLSGDGTGGNPLRLTLPLTVTSGFGTLKLLPNGSNPLYGESQDTTSSGVGVWGRGRTFGVYGEVVNSGGSPQAWGESGRLFNSRNYGLVGFTLDSEAGAAAIWGDQGGGSGQTGSRPSGVFGDSAGGIGVLGYSAASYGVEGISFGTTPGANCCVGVYGYSQNTNQAGYFFGNLVVTGSITAGVKDFKIDHPLDPANKYLVHASIESSEMLNAYSGNVVLDGAGEGLVQLPDWFQTENGDFRYQLTCVGGYAPVYVAEEISGNQFRIAGGRPGLKVSWQVTGVRQDAWARTHPLVVEEDKPEAERGLYLHPEEMGQPLEKGIDYSKHPEFLQKKKSTDAAREETPAR